MPEARPASLPSCGRPVQHVEQGSARASQDEREEDHPGPTRSARSPRWCCRPRRWPTSAKPAAPAPGGHGRWPGAHRGVHALCRRVRRILASCRRLVPRGRRRSACPALTAPSQLGARVLLHDGTIETRRGDGVTASASRACVRSVGAGLARTSLLQAASSDPLRWRRGWDSNPRYGLSPYNGLANRRLQPLGHPSAARFLLLRRETAVNPGRPGRRPAHMGPASRPNSIASRGP